MVSLLSPVSVFSLLLNYVTAEALPPSLKGLALASGRCILEPAGTGFIRHGGSFSQLLTEATPTAPLLPKPGYAKPIQDCLWVKQLFFNKRYRLIRGEKR